MSKQESHSHPRAVRRWVPTAALVFFALASASALAHDEVACCLPNGAGCIVVDHEQCENFCGTFIDEVDDCSAILCLQQFPPPPPPPQPVLGACCFDNGSCENISQCNCDNQGGTYQGDNTDCFSNCPAPFGRCCILGPPYSCEDNVTPGSCAADCGLWTDELTCDEASCPLFIGGACCIDDACITGASQEWCECKGGLYGGDFSTCDDVACAPDEGSCCLPNGSCVLTDLCDCDNRCGIFGGPGTACGVCPAIAQGRCCLPNGTCQILSSCQCADLCGTFGGAGTNCQGLCPLPIRGACCLPAGACSRVTSCQCAHECGTYQGNSTRCPEETLQERSPTGKVVLEEDVIPEPIPVPIECPILIPGACCLQDYSCIMTDSCDCADQCGEFGGSGSDCSTCVPPPVCATPAQGCWGDVINVGLTAVHMVALCNGDVLMASHDFPTVWAVFDPTTDTPGPLQNGVAFRCLGGSNHGNPCVLNGNCPGGQCTSHQLFCSGHAQIVDGDVYGKVLFMGDLGWPNTHMASIYDPWTNSWEVQEDAPAERFYPTILTLADGRALVVSGDGAEAETPDIFDPTQPMGSQWTRLPGARTGPGSPHPNLNLPTYPRMYHLGHGTRSGFTFYTGLGESDPPSSFVPQLLDSVLEHWTTAFPTPALTISGGAVMYGPDQIFLGGGKNFGPFSDVTYTVDMKAANPAWVPRASLNIERGTHFLIALPNGQILAINGQTNENFFFPVYEPEIYDFGQNQWTLMSPSQVARQYHSTAQLLGDGRILTAGAGAGFPGDETAQIFSPPYLFTPSGQLADRPTISSVNGPNGNGVLDYAEPFTVVTPDALDITTIRLIRLGAATHAWDHDHRSLELEFEVLNGGSLRVGAPIHEWAAPPGCYYLFLDAGGVPSVAAIVILRTCS